MDMQLLRQRDHKVSLAEGSEGQGECTRGPETGRQGLGPVGPCRSH